MRLITSLLVSLTFVVAGCGGGDDLIDGPDGASPIDAAAGIDGTQPTSCANGVLDDDETDVDCGGACSPCALGSRCEQASDCAAGADPVACEREASCDRDCTRVCMVDHVSCYPNPCDADEVCVQSLYVESDTTVAYCLRRHTAGEACVRYGYDKDLNDCADGLACLEVPGQLFRYTCQAAPPRSIAAAGEYCLNDVDCATGLFCNGGHRCEARGALDATCYAGNIPCQTGLECAFPAGLACRSWLNCGSQMACCATADGAECRPGPLDQCTPPEGTCQHVTP